MSDESKETKPETTKPETKLVNPPKQTEMVKKKVKVKTLRPIRIADGNQTKDIPAGEEVEVTEAEAEEFCDRKFKGAYDFFGKRLPNVGDKVGHNTVIRAVRVG